MLEWAHCSPEALLPRGTEHAAPVPGRSPGWPQGGFVCLAHLSHPGAPSLQHTWSPARGSLQHTWSPSQDSLPAARLESSWVSLSAAHLESSWDTLCSTPGVQTRLSLPAAHLQSSRALSAAPLESSRDSLSLQHLWSPAGIPLQHIRSDEETCGSLTTVLGKVTK